MTFEDVVKKAKEVGSYFSTISILDKSRDDNNLHHFVFRNEFPIADIVPSIDAAVRSIGIKLEKPVDVVVPPMVQKNTKPLNICILSHFHKMPDSFSPARATKEMIKVLQKYGHRVTLYAKEGSVLDIGCEVKAILPNFKMEKNIVNEEMRDKMIVILKEHLPQYDFCITQDFYIDSLITYREAVRNCGVSIPFLHFCRSGIGRPINFSMPNARFVYLNYSDVGHFARNIGVDVKQCRTVPNQKDPIFMFDFHPTTRMIINRFQLWDRDVIQTLPVCSTRLDAKGLDSVIRVFVELKRLGNKVALIVANSNGRKRADDLRRKQEWAKEIGLNEDELIFTSLLNSEEYNTASEIPNVVCAELMQMSNLFVFASTAEVSSNVVLESSITKQLLVLNSDLPCLFDAVNKDAVLSYPFTSNRSLHYSGRDEGSLRELAQNINKELKSNKADMQFRHVWKNYNSHSMYYNILQPLLYEKV